MLTEKLAEGSHFREMQFGGNLLYRFGSAAQHHLRLDHKFITDHGIGCLTEFFTHHPRKMFR